MHIGLGIHRNLLKLIHNTSILYRKLIQKKRIKSIHFFPEKPKNFDVIYKVSIWNGYFISDSSENADIKLHWEDCTYPKTITNISFINSRCQTISKIDVEKSFEKIFGYKLLVNPRTFKGKCVKKNNLNAKHDGVVIECPIAKPEQGFVYQYLINNTVDNLKVEDIRVPFIKGDIPFVYLKYRLITTRFSNDNSFTKLKKVSNVLSTEEITNIIEVCNDMKLEYCEIDAIKDYPTGKLYIVDINHCPSGPPNHLSLFSTLKAIKLISKTFDNKFGKK
ncbi:MAG: hypothetical protein ISS38_01255 [Candidatus Cloacimonetes bacterium]|nr:hypothetical protein [Candidatus Cloacimonadota bacterium]